MPTSAATPSFLSLFFRVSCFAQTSLRKKLLRKTDPVRNPVPVKTILSLSRSKRSDGSTVPGRFSGAGSGDGFFRIPFGLFVFYDPDPLPLMFVVNSLKLNLDSSWV